MMMMMMMIRFEKKSFRNTRGRSCSCCGPSKNSGSTATGGREDSVASGKHYSSCACDNKKEEDANNGTEKMKEVSSRRRDCPFSATGREHSINQTSRMGSKWNDCAKENWKQMIGSRLYCCWGMPIFCNVFFR
jgi:hypothetical protein